MIFERMFFTADLHLGEPNPNGYLGRPYRSALEMIEGLIKIHNKVVKPTDEVYVVGDVCVDLKYLDYISQFNGEKTLIQGNHDKNIPEEKANRYFKRIVQEHQGIALSYQGYMLFITHDPKNSQENVDLNIVGHVHGDWRIQMGYKQMLNVGVDVNNQPVCLNAIPDEIKAMRGEKKLEYFIDQYKGKKNQKYSLIVV